MDGHLHVFHILDDNADIKQELDKCAEDYGVEKGAVSLERSTENKLYFR